MSPLPVAQVQQGYANTVDIGGSRWPFYANDAFNPYAYVGTTTVVPEALLSAPPTYGQLNGNYVNGAMPTAGNVAASNPWSPSTSPLVYVIVALVVGIYGFHYLYYKDRKRK